MSLIVDASVAGSWLMPDERSPQATAIGFEVVEKTAWVPDLFWHEVRSFLVLACRRRRIAEDALWLQWGRIERMPLRSAGPSESVPVMQLALKHNLTAYDAAYLSLALSQKLPLATFDKALRAATAAEDVVVLPERLEG
jgi:predicted nucleic acid-binding protein